VTSTRRRRLNLGREAGGGLGLGIFIAKTLLERSGANVTFENRQPAGRGAVVRVGWHREDFEGGLKAAI
jgi:two-component system sensor histidine kinase RegB